MVKNRFEGHFCTFLLFPKQPFSVSVFMTRSMPVSKITNPRILRAVKNQCCQRRKFLRQKVVRRFNPWLTFAARIVLSFKHRFFFFFGKRIEAIYHFQAKAIARRKVWFQSRMSRILFATKQSWMTLRMSRPLFVSSYLQVRWFALG